MDILFYFCVILTFYRFFFYRNEYHTEYMTPSSTMSVCGIFVILVFLNHLKSYTTFQNSEIYYLFSKFMGQLIVVPFLFYSGYGIMISVMTKGEVYIKHFPFRRIFRTWLHFAIAVVLYLIVGLAQGRAYSYRGIFYAFLGLSSIGNSNWFIWTVLWLYGFTFLSVRIGKTSVHIVLCILAVHLFIYMYSMSKIAPLYFYDTAFAYFAGVLFACFRKEIESTLLSSRAHFAFVFISCFIIFTASYYWRTYTHSLISYIPWCLSFSLLFLMVTMKVKFQNPVLSFLGDHVFEIYILQRLPMNLLQGFFENDYIYALACIVLTLGMAVVFHHMLKILDQKLLGL